MRSRWAWIWLLLAAACVLELDRERACGDAFVDKEVGEQCDPGDETSYLFACLELGGIDAVAACNPDTCRLDLSPCVDHCGDGLKQQDEVCDGDRLFVSHEDYDDVCHALCNTTTMDPRPERVRCDLACAADCTALDVAASGLGCCLPGGAPILEGTAIECCASPDSGDTHCPFELEG